MKTDHKRSQFTFYASFFDGIDRLPRSRRLEAFYAVALYALDGLEPEGLAPSVDGMFQLARPNIDASRAKAEKMRKAKGEGQSEAAGEGRREETKNENEKEKKNKNKNKSEEERKKETKTETETKTKTETEPEAEAASPEDRGAPASEELSPGTELPAPAGETGLLSLPEREKKENCCGEPLSEAPVHGAALSEASVQGAPLPELREPYAEMFRADPILASAWRELLAGDAGVPPLGPAEREKLLARLLAAPAWERLAILSDRLGSPLSRSWQSVRGRLAAFS